MRDDERNEAVSDHLRALDAEIARLRKLEEAMDRRLEQAGKADSGDSQRSPGDGEPPSPP